MIAFALFPLQRSGFLLLNFCMLLLLCALIAKWTWVAFAPPPLLVMAKEDDASNKMRASVLDVHLFSNRATRELRTVHLGIKLVGLFASGQDRHSVAIFRANGKDNAVPLKGEVMPGVKLEAIHANYVLLEHDGALDRLDLEEEAPRIRLK